MRQFRNYKGGEDEAASGSPEELIRQAAAKYSGMSEDALISQLNQTVAQQKSNGTFNKQQLVDFVRQMEPFINEQQRARLMGIIDIISQ